jgi:hypothetical protein
MAMYTGDEYIAGGWKRALWYSLMWYNNAGTQSRRPPGYFAPSWSWASIPDGMIGVISTHHCHVEEGFRLIDYKIELINPFARYGAVKSGHIMVCGRVLRAHYGPNQKKSSDATHSFTIEQPESDIVEIASSEAIMDVESRWESTLGIPLLFFCVSWDYKRDKMYGLCLERLEDGRYIRVGLAHLYLQLRGMAGEWAHRSNSEDKSLREHQYEQWRANLPSETVIII